MMDIQNLDNKLLKWIEVLSSKETITPTKLTELKQDLITIHQKNQMLESLLKCIPEGVEIANCEGDILFVNENLENIAGIQIHNRVGKNIFEVHPDSVLARVLRERKEIKDTITTAPEMNKEVIAKAIPILSENHIDGAVVLFKDISQVTSLEKKVYHTTNILQEMYRINSAYYNFKNIIGNSLPMQNVIELSIKIAPVDSTVLIEGENGTGKELFAHSIHVSSNRFDKPFFRVNCAAIPEQLLESEFFGHEKGAFTGVTKTKVGIFELANGGTLFLDEIGDMPLLLQSKLLRVLQEGELRRIGGSGTIRVDVRVITATNRDLKQMVSQGNFREDLYYRINVITLRVPPLRERGDDILELAKFFISKYNKKFRKTVKGLAQSAVQVLYNHPWPGNVRELEDVMEYAVLTTDTEILSIENIMGRIPTSIRRDNTAEIMSLQEMENQLIQKAIHIYGDTLNGKKQAAQSLGISLATLYNKLKKIK